jgi:predicted nucleic acid-binding Zn ribbon protein
MNYLYTCTCGKTKERSYPLGKAKKHILCSCGKKMQRKITIPSIQFVGEGWAGNAD